MFILKFYFAMTVIVFISLFAINVAFNDHLKALEIYIIETSNEKNYYKTFPNRVKAYAVFLIPVIRFFIIAMYFVLAASSKETAKKMIDDMQKKNEKIKNETLK